MPPRSPPPPRPTHFLSIPLGHHPSLHSPLTTLHSALSSSDPPIAGLDPSIIIPPARVHLTLGVMALHARRHPPPVPVTTQDRVLHSQEQALEILRGLRGRVQDVLQRKDGEGGGAGEEGVRVKLEQLGWFPERGSPEKANVLWAAPRKGEEGRLLEVANLVRQAFVDVGMITERRPLTLHATLLNTAHRKTPRAPPAPARASTSTSTSQHPPAPPACEPAKIDPDRNVDTAQAPPLHQPPPQAAAPPKKKKRWNSKNKFAPREPYSFTDVVRALSSAGLTSSTLPVPDIPPDASGEAPPAPEEGPIGPSDGDAAPTTSDPSAPPFPPTPTPQPPTAPQPRAQRRRSPVPFPLVDLGGPMTVNQIVLARMGSTDPESCGYVSCGGLAIGEDGSVGEC